MKILDKYLPKKFRVRIQRPPYSKSYYYHVEYSNGRLFTRWTQIDVYLDSIEKWNPLMEYYTKAKKIAKGFKSMEDVEKFMAKEMSRYEAVKQRKDETQKRLAPVTEEVIY